MQNKKNKHPTFPVNVDEIDQNFSTYLQRVESGVTVRVVRAGKAVAEIKPITSHPDTVVPFQPRQRRKGRSSKKYEEPATQSMDTVF